jgi:ABC-type nickel/cobalt efflux system permease component RcnA
MKINILLLCIIVLLFTLGYAFKYPISIRIALAVSGILLLTISLRQIWRLYHERRK